jgi:four helix bundle protein
MHPKTIALQARTQKFAADVIKLCDTLAKDAATQRIVSQLVDSSGATDSNYRATCRARSKAEFIAKIGVAAEEADESKGWLELLVASRRIAIEQARDLIQEANELVAIFVRSRKTAERRKAEQERDEKQLRAARAR